MNSSELITAKHLAKKAIIYICQSTQKQMTMNQESLKLQYNLEERAIELGWPKRNIDIIDADLGLTGSAASHREGFKEILAQVTLNKVGIILSYDVTRLSRNCSDWYPLLDICGFKNCLIADWDGVYDSSTPNGRLLLGLKGQLAEVELNTIRTRMTAGLLNKAKRGDLSLKLPAGLLRDQNGYVNKDPNLEVQNRIKLIFDLFLQAKSASKTVRYLNENMLLIPRYDNFQTLHWRTSTICIIMNILTNPAYAGAFAYGRSRVFRTGPSPKEKKIKHLPLSEWKFLVKNKFPAYISWEIFEKIQFMLKDNYINYGCYRRTRGIARSGPALLQGIICCGKCGHKMTIRYREKGKIFYVCCYAKTQYKNRPTCQHLPAEPIHNFVINAFFKALSPIEFDAYNEVIEAQTLMNKKTDQAHTQQLERLRYQTQLAKRQFDQVDPDNRLVAVELEKRWENALQELKAAEDFIETKKQKGTPIKLPDELKETFKNICKKLPDIWDKPILSYQHKKSFLRCLIDKVVIHREKQNIIKARIIWKGGETTTKTISVGVRSFSDLSFAKKMESLIVEEVKKTNKSDFEIAQYLTELGFYSPQGKIVLQSTIKSIRIKNGLFRERKSTQPLQVKGFLTIRGLANILSITPWKIRYHILNGRIKIKKDEKTNAYLFPDNPKTIALFKRFLKGNLYELNF